MTGKRAVETGSIAWAAVGAGVALAALSDVNNDARLLVGVASVLLPLCAVGAALLLRRNQPRAAGLLLLFSAATPTYFAYVLNIPALVAGLVLLAAPALVRSQPHARSGSTSGGPPRGAPLGRSTPGNPARYSSSPKRRRLPNGSATWNSVRPSTLLRPGMLCPTEAL